jgi:flagellar protein FlaG
MVGDFGAMTATSARTSATDSRVRLVGGSVVPSGNASAPTGEKLPASSAPPAPPVFDVAQAVARLNELMSSHNRSLRFEVDASSGRTVITVINEATKEVVRQIPPPELLQIARNLDAMGSLIDARA